MGVTLQKGDGVRGELVYLSIFEINLAAILKNVYNLHIRIQIHRHDGEDVRRNWKLRGTWGS